MTVCAWCELELDIEDPESIRLSNTQPPWRATRPRAYTAAAVVAAMGASFASALGSAREEEITVWFHRRCWRSLRELLRSE